MICATAGPAGEGDLPATWSHLNPSISQKSGIKMGHHKVSKSQDWGAWSLRFSSTLMQTTWCQIQGAHNLMHSLSYTWWYVSFITAKVIACWPAWKLGGLPDADWSGGTADVVPRIPAEGSHAWWDEEELAGTSYHPAHPDPGLHILHWKYFAISVPSSTHITWGVQVLRSPNLLFILKKLLTTGSWKCSHFSM